MMDLEPRNDTIPARDSRTCLFPDADRPVPITGVKRADQNRSLESAVRLIHSFYEYGDLAGILRLVDRKEGAFEQSKVPVYSEIFAAMKLDVEKMIVFEDENGVGSLLNLADPYVRASADGLSQAYTIEMLANAEAAIALKREFESSLSSIVFTRKFATRRDKMLSSL